MLISGKIAKARRTIIYGVHGIGKTTFAAQFPNAAFVQTEEGANDLDTVRFGWKDEAGDEYTVGRSHADILSALEWFGTQEHDRKTLVLDSANWEEKLRQEAVCAERQVASIEDISFGKGYTFALDKLHAVLLSLDGLRDQGMEIVIIGHAVAEMFEPPGKTPYKRYTLETHKSTRARLFDWADDIFFANYEVYVREVNEGTAKNPKVKGIATGNGARMLYTTERPGWQAKNRLGLPDEIPMDFETYWKLRNGEPLE